MFSDNDEGSIGPDEEEEHGPLLDLKKFASITLDRLLRNILICQLLEECINVF